ncbi:MAG: hypothetical protein HY890_08610 [Deltaproteobacteria bacterium]|nr:hypothetical protein [Deltaproteobacteria bacterium]
MYTKILTFFTGALMIFSIALAPALAGEKGDMGGMMMGDDMKGPHREDMIEHHRMTQDALRMLRETMVILRDLSHKPTAEERKKLDGMISRLDDMVKKHEEMMKRKKEMWEEKKDRMEMKDKDREKNKETK